jgi:hypothetical protein
MRGRTKPYLKSGSRCMFFYEHSLPSSRRFYSHLSHLSIIAPSRTLERPPGAGRVQGKGRGKERRDRRSKHTFAGIAQYGLPATLSDWDL